MGCLPTAPQVPVCSCHRDSTWPIPLPRAAARNGPHPVPAPRAEASGSAELRPEYRLSLLHTVGRAFVLGYKSGFRGLRPVKRKFPRKWLLFSLLFQRRHCSQTGLTPCKPVAGLRPACPRLLGSLELPLQNRHAQGRHVTAARMPPSDKTDGAERGEGCGGQTLGRCGGRKQRTDSSYNPASPLLSLCPGDVNTHPRKDADTNLHGSTFIVAQLWGQPTCPPHSGPLSGPNEEQGSDVLHSLGGLGHVMLSGESRVRKDTCPRSCG